MIGRENRGVIGMSLGQRGMQTDAAGMRTGYDAEGTVVHGGVDQVAKWGDLAGCAAVAGRVAPTPPVLVSDSV
jgi:hypothetical protein